MCDRITWIELNGYGAEDSQAKLLKTEDGIEIVP